MKLLFLLVMLTQNDAGDVNAAFVSTPTLLECQQKEAMVEGIFISAGVQVIESRCIESDLRFSEFDHASSSKMQRYFYLISTSGTQLKIRKKADWYSCMSAQKNHASTTNAWCANSIQTILE